MDWLKLVALGLLFGLVGWLAGRGVASIVWELSDQEIPDAQERVDHAWFSRASENSLFAAGGEFFISVGGAGSLELGWVCVRWLKGVQMASRLMQGDGNLEFLGMSVSGRYVCGVTTEESDYWVAEKWFE